MKEPAFFLILVLLSGCAVGPNYKRPAVNVPTDYRAAITPAAPASSLGNEKWWDVFQDPMLIQLIHTALQQNYDVRIAATRVLEAQDQLGITRANQFPSAAVGAGLSSEQNPKVSNLLPPYQVNAGQLSLSVIWNLDFWGKYRRQTEAARAQLLATEWGQRGGDFLACFERGDRLFSASGTRQPAGDRQADAGVSSTIATIDSDTRHQRFSV